MSERRNYTSATGKKAGKDIIQGRFFSLDFLSAMPSISLRL